MELTASPTEFTTSVTDLILALECIVLVFFLHRIPTRARWRVNLWSWAFGLLAFAAFLGAASHGLALQPSLREWLWRPLNLSLGIVVALFLAGAFGDWRGPPSAIRLVLWCTGLGAIFFGVTELLSHGFAVFVIYEGTAMAVVLVVYLLLVMTRRLRGAAVIAAAVLLNLVAAGVHASRLALNVVVPFDHNGLFHLVQMLAVAVLALGLSMGFERQGSRNLQQIT